MEKLKHLIESQQFTPEILFYLFNKADELRLKTQETLKGKIMATLFYEPSTRTRLSFESAMLKLGGQVLSTENAKDFSSSVKGESLHDTSIVVSSYADVIVMRHYEDGAAKKAAEVSKVPIINAGDGKGQHPTQALLDMYTIYRELGRLNNLKVAMVGDLASGRTVRSLSYLLGKFTGNEIILVSPPHLRMKDDVKEYLKKHNTPLREESDINKILPEADIIYMVRTQKERISLEDYKKVEKQKTKLTISSKNFNLIKSDARIMHPLPKVDEIDLPVEVEQNDKRVAYFRQAENGLFIRMAFLDFMLG